MRILWWSRGMRWRRVIIDFVDVDVINLFDGDG